MPANFFETFVMMRGKKKAGTRQASEHAVIGSHDRMEAARVVSGGLLRRRGMALDQLHLPAARAQPLAYRGPRQAGADDARLFFFNSKNLNPGPNQPGAQHLAFS